MAKPAVKLALLLARDAGLRQGTILQFAASNCNFEQRLVTGRTKRYTSYSTPMTRRLYTLLRWMCAGVKDQNEPLIARFKNRGKGTYHAHYLAQLLKTAQKAAGLEGCEWTLHDLRRTAARTLYKATHDIRKVQRLLSHASPYNTLWYLGNAAIDIEPEEIEMVHKAPERKLA